MNVSRFSLFVLAICLIGSSFTSTARGQTNAEMLQVAYAEATGVRLMVRPNTMSMLQKSAEFSSIVYYQLAWAEQLGFTPTQIAAIEALKAEGESYIAAFEQLWNLDNFEINPSGLSEGYIWVYSFPELTNYQYMFKWYDRGCFCMTVYQHPFNPDGLIPEAIDSFIQSQIRMESYIRHCQGLTGQLDRIITTLETYTGGPGPGPGPGMPF